MNELTMKIHNIKGISRGSITLPIENGLFAIVGHNGTGKSTIMSCLAQLISPHNLGLLRKDDYDESSYVEFTMNGKTDCWTPEANRRGVNGAFWGATTHPNCLKYNGLYEGSLFYGIRFHDSKSIDKLIEEGKITTSDLKKSDAYITENLGTILHNNALFYESLQRIRHRDITKKFKLKNTPYFRQINNRLISQYRMSSGECLLISLLHFIYNSIICRSLPRNQPILMLIDEVELALHPLAISNLIKLLEELVITYKNLTIIITSHSAEVIRKIAPRNMYMIENISSEENVLNVINPCYASYAIRDIYQPDGYDYVLLVEDELAKYILERAIEHLKLNESCLINITPAGGWRNVLKLQYEMCRTKMLGTGKQIISILDGDIKDEVSTTEYTDLKKLFLPVASIEKFLLTHLVNNLNQSFKKKLGDSFFTIKSIDTILAEYQNYELSLEKTNSVYSRDTRGKRLYRRLTDELAVVQISEKELVAKLYQIISEINPLDRFHESLKNILQN